MRVSMPDGRTPGGHFLSAHVEPLLEVFGGRSVALRRKHDAATGVSLMDPGPSKPIRIMPRAKKRLLGHDKTYIKARLHKESILIKRVLAAFLCVFVPTFAFASKSGDNGYKVIYDGGSVQQLKTGTSAELIIDPTQIRLHLGKGDVVTIPAAAVTEISYGQDVHRRVGAAIGLAVVSFGIGALMALTKSKKHYVGLTWADGDKKGGFAMQCDKNEYRGVLAALEGITGKKAVDSDAMTVKN